VRETAPGTLATLSLNAGAFRTLAKRITRPRAPCAHSLALHESTARHGRAPLRRSPNS
jgi:hypothetical protein